MQPPLHSSDTLFAQLLQDLPPQLAQSARECKALTRRRKLQTPADVLRCVLLYCGLDQSLREVAGTMTWHLGQGISDTAIGERLVTAQPWIKALVQEMLGVSTEMKLPLAGRRLMVVDASHVTGPAAPSTE